MKQKLYALLVSRVPGIRSRYLQKRQESGKLAALLYLFWLNVRYYLLLNRSLAAPLEPDREKTLPLAAESAAFYTESPQKLAEKLLAYDIVCFDVFDTLLWRTCARPEDVFWFVGLSLKYPGFKTLRIEAERQTRLENRQAGGSGEVTLEEIWRVVSRQTGIPVEKGIQTEWEWEQRFCRANPYFLEVLREFHQNGKSFTVISDMYLGKERIDQLLCACGYEKPSETVVSCDWGVCKSGGLFHLFREKHGETLSYVHTGDHPESDIRAAKQAGFEAVYRPAAVRESLKWRTEDLSFLTGSVYCGLTGGKLHSGERLFSRDYEFGYLYGGLFAVGFGRFIHACRRKYGFDKLLFLSRDGSTLLEVYRLLYPEESQIAVYAPWSRLAALKINAQTCKAEFFRRFLADKANHGFSLRSIVHSMEVPDWLEPLCRETGFSPETHLTHKNLKKIENYFSENEAQLFASYEPQRQAGGEFYRALLGGCHRAAAVDIGWAGSGPLLLDRAVNEIWNLNCPITGILAGTETAHSAQPDAYAPFLTSGKLLAYLFSPFHNRDLWSFHDPAQGHNLYWELFSGTAEGGLLGFYPGENGKPVCRLRENHKDPGRMAEIRRGMLDFARDFLETEQRLGMQLPISGRDAYAPMLLAERHANRRFWEEWEGLFDDVHIG